MTDHLPTGPDHLPPGPAAPARRSVELVTLVPWVLVAMLVLGLVWSLFTLDARNREIVALRAVPPGTGAAAPAPGPAPSASPASQDPQVTALLKSLPRRVPGDPLAKGKVDAPVVLIEWSDWRCPFCAKWSRETSPALQPYIDSGSLRVEYRDLVLFGEESENAARGGRAAAAQGRFWEYSRAVYAAAPLQGHPTITDTEVMAFAKAAGVPDLEKFTTDYTSTEARQAVTADTNEARQLGLTSTPFFVVNTTPVSGAYPTEYFTQLIEGYGGHR